MSNTVYRPDQGLDWWQRSLLVQACTLSLFLLFAGYAGADSRKDSLSAVTAAEPTRDDTDCADAARASLASDYVVDTALKRVAKRAERRIVAIYKTDAELKGIIMFLRDELIAQCLKDRGFREFSGFFIHPPQGKEWAVGPTHAELEALAFIKKLSPDTPGAGEPHTVIAMVVVKHLAFPPGSRDERLQHLIQSKREEWQDPRYKLLRFETAEDRSLDADCIRYTITAEDRGVPGFPGAVFVFTDRGLRCVHPDRLASLNLPSPIVEIGYSQRFRNGRWIEAFDAEVEPFLNSVVFTPLDPRPAMIASLENYASLLRHVNRDGEARDIQKKVEKLREAFTSKGSTHLGFTPSVVLREYAALLQTQNREAEAKEMNALANVYDHRQFEEFLRLRLQQTR